MLHIITTRNGAAKLIVALYESEKPLTVSELKKITQCDDNELYHGTLIALKNNGIVKTEGRASDNRFLTWTINDDYKFRIEKDLNLFKECAAAC